MAATTPDPTTLTSSAEIFSANHSLPQIRSIHKSLHAQIDEKSTRLRTQVGDSYRELLGTADTIVRMRGDNEHVQDLLGKMGSRCGRAIVSSKAEALSKFATRERYREAAGLARLKLLDACNLTTERVLKGGAGLDEQSTTRGDRLVLATKVFVISRLLAKSTKAEDVPGKRGQQALDAAARKIESLRRRLQRSVERCLETADDGTDTDGVVKALCAHSLANSSGAKHAIWYFLRVRQRAMEAAFDVAESDEHTGTTADDVVRSLGLYTKTLLDVQALVPTKLSQSLSALKSQRLLADTSLKKLEGLRFDTYERWCMEEIQYFTPFVQHDDLDSKHAREMLSTFAEDGSQVVLSGLTKTLDAMADFKTITDLRTQVLQLWIRDGGRAKGFDPQEVQDELGEAIMTRLLSVLETKVTKLRLVGSEIKATLEAWQDGATDRHAGLWDEDGYDAALQSGAAPFVGEVVSRLYGRSDAVSKASHGYASWFHIIDDVKKVVEELRKQRWDNDYDEIEDEETIEERQRVLSKQDPKKLQDKLDASLDVSFKHLQEQMEAFWSEYSDKAPSAAMAVYLVRVLRDIRSQLPERPGLDKFGLDMVPSLHERVAAKTSQPAVDQLLSKGLSDRSIIAKPLWEGNPPLPNQPSPTLFMFLQELAMSMTDTGVDLWTPAAVNVLKKQVTHRLLEAWRDELKNLSDDGDSETIGSDGVEEPEDGETKAVNGDGVNEDAESKQDPAASAQDVCIQWLFDLSLLRSCVSNHPDNSDDMDKLQTDVLKRSQLDDVARIRLTKSATDYWQRVSLLFGVLA